MTRFLDVGEASRRVARAEAALCVSEDESAWVNNPSSDSSRCSQACELISVDNSSTLAARLVEEKGSRGESWH